MYDIWLSLVLFITQSFLILTTKINSFPEIFFFPWLVSKGLIPYRDFFDHHGFLLYYILAPLTADKSMIGLRIFYFFIQTVNLFLVLKILKKITNKSGFFLGGLLFVFVNFFASGNTWWYELAITTIYLIIFLVWQKNIKRKYFIIGVLVALASFIKPTAAIILIPICFIVWNIIPVFTFLFSWMIVLFLFFIKGGLIQLINNLFLFNFYLSQHYYDPYFSDERFVYISALIVILAIGINLISRKLKKAIPLVFFTLFSIIFFFRAYNRPHLVPVATFGSLLVAQTISSVKRWRKTLLIGALLIYLLIIVRKIYIERISLDLYRSKNNNKKYNQLMKKEKVYVLGNQPQFYYFSNQLPSTHYPLLFPLVDKYVPGFETQLINELGRNNVRTIIIPLPVEEQFSQLSVVKNYIYQKYTLLERTKDFEIYIRKKLYTADLDRIL